MNTEPARVIVEALNEIDSSLGAIVVVLILILVFKNCSGGK